MNIKNIENPWRNRWQNARFRAAGFFVEQDARSGGRRVAMHEYPKRNTPYAEDMGRKALRFMVQGYLIGPNYWDHKNRLIDALDKDGPGFLRLPLPYQMADVNVMVNTYTVTEHRERGGYCTIEMDFSEYGDPQFRQDISTSDQIEGSALKLEDQLIKSPNPILAGPYAEVHKRAVKELPPGFVSSFGRPR
jgi:prophage DNA circulation protein